jgi:hypothetical protein
MSVRFICPLVPQNRNPIATASKHLAIVKHKAQILALRPIGDTEV